MKGGVPKLEGWLPEFFSESFPKLVLDSVAEIEIIKFERYFKALFDSCESN